MNVELLADHPDWIPVIAKWHWDEWGHLDRTGSLKKWTQGLARRAHRDRIPMTFVAVEDDQPVGSAALVVHDMETRKELSPWLIRSALAGDFELGVDELLMG